jgi:hypothetical protein
VGGGGGGEEVIFMLFEILGHSSYVPIPVTVSFFLRFVDFSEI